MPRVVRSATILVAAPDRAFRRSLVFALESGGFTVDAHAGATDAFASGSALHAACAVVDDGAVSDWNLASRQFDHFSRPVILLVGFLHQIPVLPFARPLMKPFLGEPLVKAVRDAVSTTL
jgi:FixJ family two-component response regulator